MEIETQCYKCREVKIIKCNWLKALFFDRLMYEYLPCEKCNNALFIRREIEIKEDARKWKAERAKLLRTERQIEEQNGN